MELSPGTLLQGGKYRIIRTLGKGGFGITYEAEQVNLERIIALKEFFMKNACEREAATSHVTVPTQENRELVEKFRRKFLREAKMMAGMSNAHIVSVLDVFEENGTAYYVMENLPGGSLADKVKKDGPMPEAEAEKYIREVASALSYIHARNTVHLDVKPSNILLNADGEAVLIDFGISKHYDSSGEQTSSTPVGISKGYAPLEQGRDGDVSQFKPSTDIYALGATLYNLVSGQVPPEATLVAEEGLTRPSGLSDRLWRTISESMKPFRKDRPQSIAEFLALLDAPDAAHLEENDTEEVTRIIDAERTIPPTESSGTAPKPKKTWLWVLLGAIAVAAIAAGLMLGGGGKRANVSHTLSPVSHADAPVKGTDKPQPSGGPATAFATTGTTSGGTSSGQTTGSINGHEWVDLGLPSGLKWASMNVGASSTSDYGSYFAWGEISSKTEYTLENYWFRVTGGFYPTYGAYCRTFSKYNTKSGRGTVDNKKRLEHADDAARMIWGSTWRIPSDEEWDELLTSCDWTWTSQGGKDGYKVISKTNGNSIFLPAAGFRINTFLDYVGFRGYYWSSSLSTDRPDSAWYVNFNSGDVSSSYFDRFYGFSVRPVSE